MSQLNESAVSISDSQSQIARISQDFENRPPNDDQLGTWRKHPWLASFFTKELKRKQMVGICRACGKEEKSRHHNRLIAHLLKCKKSNYDRNMPVIMEDLQTTASITTDMFLRALVDAGWTFNGIESPYVRKFFTRLNPRWTIPTRKDLSGIYIPRISLQLHKDFMDSLTMCKSFISIEFDHWEDANHRSFLGVLATKYNGSRFLLDLRDVSLKGHHSSVIVDELVSSLMYVPKKAINSIISDSASTCKKARQDIVQMEAFKHVIQHRCLAHFVNLIGSRITQKDHSLSETVRLASKVAVIISSSSYWTAYVRGLNYKPPQSACAVRWFSIVTMLKAVKDLKNVLIEDIVPKLDQEKAHIVAKINWSKLADLIDVVEPLCSCIGEIEKNDTGLGEGLRHILEYGRKLFASERECYSQDPDYKGLTLAKIEARKSFLHYFSEQRLTRSEFALYLAAYALDRRYKIDWITAKGIQLVIEAIIRIAVQSGATIEQVKASIFLEFDYYKNFHGEYKMTDMEPISWWNERNKCGVLATVGSRLAHLKASSANIERTFSSLKFIQNDYRLNMSESTLLHTARIKLSLKDEQTEESSSFSQELIADTNVIDENEDSVLDDDLQLVVEPPTFATQQDWLEDQDVATKRNFQYFFEMIDFNLQNDNDDRSSDGSLEVTEEQIRSIVEEGLNPGDGQSGDVIIEDAEQIREIDVLAANPCAQPDQL